MGGYGDARVKDKELPPVVQTLDSAIHQIKIYPAENAIGFPNTSPLDSAIQCLKNRGLEKSQFLEKRNRKLVEGEVKVVPIVTEALGAVSDMFEKLNVAIRVEVIERAALLGTAGLLRKVLAI